MLSERAEEQTLLGLPSKLSAMVPPIGKWETMFVKKMTLKRGPSKIFTHEMRI
jgi:hypothetical protein